jgi:hypothetical protein
VGSYFVAQAKPRWTSWKPFRHVKLVSRAAGLVAIAQSELESSQWPLVGYSREAFKSPIDPLTSRSATEIIQASLRMRDILSRPACELRQRVVFLVAWPPELKLYDGGMDR